MRLHKLFLLKDRQESNTFHYLDPTVIIRLHSIISGKDIFTLSNLVDYKINYESETLISMKLPNNMLKSLRMLNLDLIYSVSEKWYNSKEVKLYDWDINECQKYLLSLMNITKTPTSNSKIYLQYLPNQKWSVSQ